MIVAILILTLTPSVTLTVTLTPALTLTLTLSLTLTLTSTLTQTLTVTQTLTLALTVTLVCARCNGFGISPFQSERRLDLRTISAKTKARLIHEVDARNGWVLEEKTEEVQRVKRQTKAKVRQLTGEHKRAMQNMALETTTALDAAKEKHTSNADLKKLHHQKEALVDRAKEPRKLHKVTIACAVGNKHDALSILCSAVECAK